MSKCIDGNVARGGKQTSQQSFLISGLKVIQHHCSPGSAAFHLHSEEVSQSICRVCSVGVVFSETELGEQGITDFGYIKSPSQDGWWCKPLIPKLWRQRQADL